MITGRVIAPKLVLHPKNTVDQWIVLLGGPKLRPNEDQTMQRTEPRRSDMGVIVPDHACVPGWLIGQDRESYQAKPWQPVTTPRRWEKSHRTFGLMRVFAGSGIWPSRSQGSGFVIITGGVVLPQIQVAFMLPSSAAPQGARRGSLLDYFPSATESVTARPLFSRQNRRRRRLPTSRHRYGCARRRPRRQASRLRFFGPCRPRKSSSGPIVGDWRECP